MALGSDSKQAIKRTTTWGTAGTPGAGDLFIIDSDTLNGGAEGVVEPGLNGSVWGTPGPILGSIITRGSITAGARFATNVDLLWALAMGSAGTATDTGDGVAYTHAIDLADSLTEQFSFWIDKNVSVWEVDSAMINSIDFTASLNGRFTFNVDVIGRNLDYDSAASLATATEPEDTNGQNTFWNLNKATFRINAQSGAALTDANGVEISEFSLSLNNNLAADDFLTATDSCAGVIAKPTRLGQPSVTGSFSLPEYAVNTWRDAYANASEFKMDLEFCGPVITGSSETYKVTFQFPRVRIVEMPDNSTPGPDRIPNQVLFQAFEADAAPTGMTGVTKPFRIVYQNSRSTDILS